MLSGSCGKWVRFAIAALLGAALILALPRVAPAEDVSAARRDIAGAEDFRLRVSAALTLGRVHAEGARPLLEHALSDPHPAVRTAAAAALAVLGDAAAVPALERRAASETSASARAQMRTSIETLGRVAQGPWQNARYVVQLGEMKNRTGVRGEEAGRVLRSATRARALNLVGAVLAEGGDNSILEEAAGRHVPVLVLDGSLQRLAQGQHDAQLTFDAQVEFSVRRVPEQMLRGVISGAATSVGSLGALSNPKLVAMLQNQAIDGAVESAMRGAAQGLAQAAAK